MKKILAFLAFLVALPAYAQVTASDLMGLGMPGALAGKVASIGNAESGQSVNLAVNGTTEVKVTDNLLQVVGNGTTDIVNIGTNTANAADSGALVLMGFGGVKGGSDQTGRGASMFLYGNEHSGDGGVDFYLGDTTGNFKVIGNSNGVSLLDIEDNGDTATFKTDLILNVGGDPQRLVTFSSSSDTAQTLTFGDAGVTAAQIFTISASTADADDDAILRLAGGGGIGDSRGAWIRLFGNEGSTAGALELYSGNVATGNVSFAIEHASSSFIFKDTTSGNLVTISNAGNIATAGTVTSSLATNLGWSVVDGTDNTTCESQCTSAAVFGFDLAAGASAPVLVGPATATADICLCAGAS